MSDPAAFSLRAFRRWVPVLPALLLAAPLARAQQNTPHIGYVYPAGGRQGTTFQVVVGGQFLMGATNVYFSGNGVRATVVECNRPMQQKEFNELRNKLRALMEKRRMAARAARRGLRLEGTNVWTSADQAMFIQIRTKLLKNPPNRQGNPAIAETVLVRVTVAAQAEPGEREVRLGTPIGLSNPMVFRVGELPEFSRPARKSVTREISRLRQRFGLPPEDPANPPEMRITLPATVNGQILPGGVDRYRFSARKGQRLVISVSARELVPYLADAVPGWFQAVLTLCDAKGKELAYDDRYRYHPDPVIHYIIPRDGEYLIRVRDSLYRGREDFVYRLTVGELPFVTGIFPLGGRAGTQTRVELSGWNLPVKTLMVRDDGKRPGVYFLSMNKPFSPLPQNRENGVSDPACSDAMTESTMPSVTLSGGPFNPVPFAVDSLPECLEKEPDNSSRGAEPIKLPVIVNGRVNRPGDRDVFRFEGRSGERIVAEVWARRLGSPLDSFLKLTDAAGHQLAFNDDYDDEGEGLETHHADSRLAAVLPTAGTYYLTLGDVQHQGGRDYCYRLRISGPRPDFALRLVPSSLNVRPGISVPVTVYALRRDGFTNAIELALKGAPRGFMLSGARIPANANQARFTLTALSLPGGKAVDLSLEGRALIGGEWRVHPAVPADDRMQAFIYRHLVCADELKVGVIGRGRTMARPWFRILGETPVKIPAGGTARVRVAALNRALASRFELELDNPPDGIALQRVSPLEGINQAAVLPRGREAGRTGGQALSRRQGGGGRRLGRGRFTEADVELVLHCDAAKLKPGVDGNLIVNVVPRVNQAAAKRRPRAAKQHRPPIGVLPAIPFEIVSAGSGREK